MNVSRVGMSMPKPTMQAQPSFKGWITDGKTAVREECVVTVNSSGKDSKDATMRLYNGQEIKTNAKTELLTRCLQAAHENGFYKEPGLSFLV